MKNFSFNKRSNSDNCLVDMNDYEKKPMST